MAKTLTTVSIVALLSLLPAAAAAQKLVILTRHAERADAGKAEEKDPLLSQIGEARAAKLALMLADSGVKAIFATEFRRTQNTAKPLATKLGLTVNVVPGADTTGLVARLKKQHAADIVFIVGHSDTVPETIKALGGPTVTIQSTDFDNLFVLVPATGALTRIRFTAALAPTPQELAALWDQEHLSSPLTPLVGHAEVAGRLKTLGEDSDLFRVRRLGESGEGRAISLVSFGSGPYPVLLWSQMHGDEGTATSALFDLYAYVHRHRREPHVQQLLSALTIHTLPMLNPDGAERWQRRNVQGLDINRDALLLQSPEGRILKALRDELNPKVGFNLHNQSWSTTAGRPPQPAAISLLSVAYDEARTVNEGRLLTKRLGAVVRNALEPFAAGRMGRYDDSFEVRAFGDNVTKWGTPVLLIETGPWPDEQPDPALVRLNFLALLSALGALADGTVALADPVRYDTLPENESFGFYYLIKNVTIRAGAGVPPFVGDVGISANRRVRLVDGERRLFLSASVGDLGDLRTYSGLFEIDGTGRVLAPLAPDAAPGATVMIEPITGTLQVGSAADLMLVAPAGAGYRVERVFRAQTEVTAKPSR